MFGNKMKYFSGFNDVAYYCGKELHNYIPLTFMLAFFVSIIVERWRTTFSNMGWIEAPALTLNATITSKCDEARLIKRNIVRYLVLAQILTFRDISIRVRRRFPNIDSIKKAGFLMDSEEELLEDIDLDYNKYWVPMNWCMSLVNRANSKGFVVSPPGMVHLIQEIKTFRSGLATLCNYDWCPIPIAYPQNKDFEAVQLFIRPFITIIEFICIVGWMKVAEALLNPLGEDDDDFESNYLIDKNIFTGMRIVDCSEDTPVLSEDIFSDPGAMPIYSEESQRNQQNGALVGSVSNVTLAQFGENITMVPVAPRLSIGDIASHDRPSIRRRYRSGTASQNPSRANSFREPRIPRQSSIGESNDGYELDYEGNIEDLTSTSPTRHGKFFTNLTKVDENDEDLPATAKTSVVSRV
uniref:Bestrophin homolog n=1 Tax=Caenorhabditis tropicalis TaxID=1561998 RepID=A0A1I7T299_9PELO